MPRTYQRNTNRQSWSQESIEGAIEEVLSGRMGYLKAAKSFTVPQSTLEDRVKKVRSNQLTSKQAASKGGLGLCTTVFSEQQERELVYHILPLES
ncbi:CENP-B N-terminal DNA-binding domain [Popillia japonica]|uniref:CENP-B N-terminal DNA-binding domain n=1 Tax=Popillia japonica TaxID=7064 RepID=A0AAW1JVG3_POPJA